MFVGLIGRRLNYEVNNKYCTSKVVGFFLSRRWPPRARRGWLTFVGGEHALYGGASCTLVKLFRLPYGRLVAIDCASLG